MKRVGFLAKNPFRYVHVVKCMHTQMLSFAHMHAQRLVLACESNLLVSILAVQMLTLVPNATGKSNIDAK
jgi:hypothetical protein